MFCRKSWFVACVVASTVSLFQWAQDKKAECDNSAPINLAASAYQLIPLHQTKTSFLVSCYDFRRRVPLWVLQHTRQSSLIADNANLDEDADEGGTSLSSNSLRKKTRFVSEQALEALFRVKPAEYSNSGYDKGHMAPAADHTENGDVFKTTFSMANIAPQVL